MSRAKNGSSTKIGVVWQKLDFLAKNRNFGLKKRVPLFSVVAVVRIKKCFFLGQKFWFLAKKSNFCHTTPILVDDPFLALGMTVNFPHWEPFFDWVWTRKAQLHLLVNKIITSCECPSNHSNWVPHSTWRFLRLCKSLGWCQGVGGMGTSEGGNIAINEWKKMFISSPTLYCICIGYMLQ